MLTQPANKKIKSLWTLEFMHDVLCVANQLPHCMIEVSKFAVSDKILFDIIIVKIYTGNSIALICRRRTESNQSRHFFTTEPSHEGFYFYGIWLQVLFLRMHIYEFLTFEETILQRISRTEETHHHWFVTFSFSVASPVGNTFFYVAVWTTTPSSRVAMRRYVTRQQDPHLEIRTQLATTTEQHEPTGERCARLKCGKLALFSIIIGPPQWTSHAAEIIEK